MFDDELSQPQPSNQFFSVDETGKPVFRGQEDPNNPPSIPAPANSRWCGVCKKHGPNTDTCPSCGSYYDDSKMKCQVCGGWFDYLLGVNNEHEIQCCESCWQQGKGVRK